MSLPAKRSSRGHPVEAEARCVQLLRPPAFEGFILLPDQRRRGIQLHQPPTLLVAVLLFDEYEVPANKVANCRRLPAAFDLPGSYKHRQSQRAHAGILADNPLRQQVD
jgi:hypothetical protein